MLIDPLTDNNVVLVVEAGKLAQDGMEALFRRWFALLATAAQDVAEVGRVLHVRSEKRNLINGGLARVQVCLEPLFKIALVPISAKPSLD